MPDSQESSSPPSQRDASQARVEALQLHARQAGLALRAPPPLPTGCCGRGCNGCVWEGYFSAMDYWCEEAGHKLAAVLS